MFYQVLLNMGLESFVIRAIVFLSFGFKDFKSCLSTRIEGKRERGGR